MILADIGGAAAAVLVVIGLLVGVSVVAVIWLLQARFANRQSRQMREAFKSMAAEALDANSRRFIELAGANLESKKELIGQSIAAMSERLERVRGFVQQVESDRQKHYGHLVERLSALSATTESLRNALAGSKRLGAWGERMTEDVLRFAGMQEGINFIKQSSEAVEGSGKPDFTFMLPNDLVVNMDVKFPLEKAMGVLDAADEDRRKVMAREFVSAVRGHVRTVASAKRGYINTAGGTVNYAIVFIPNEQVYSMAMELDPQLMDEALKMRIVMCGPLTLYAMLSVIRSAAENANIVKTADEVINLLGAFDKQWRLYCEAMDKMGMRLDQARTEYDNLITTRTNMLDRPLDKIAELRTARGLPAGGQESNAQE